MLLGRIAELDVLSVVEGLTDEETGEDEDDEEATTVLDL